MKLKKLSCLALSLLLCACNQNTVVDVVYLTAEDKGTATVRIYKDNNFEGNDRYIAPKNVEMKYSYQSLSGLLANNESVCPSTGDVNLLIIPVHLPGENKYNTEEVRNDIKQTFFGKADDKDYRNGYVSLSEYYHQSSFGKLNFQGVVTDWFDVEEHTNVKSLSDVTMGSDGTIIKEILRKAVDWAKTTQDINLKDFDKNNDGSIDAVWLVYDHLDYATEAEDPSFDFNNYNPAFWNFTNWDWETLPNVDEPTTSAFSWASFDMMYTGYAPRNEYTQADLSSLSTIPLDSHTFIHETGHLLGLDDYYATDDMYYRPTGKSTMMDQNVGDLDSYSKMLLGWVTPYVVYGTSEILLPKASEYEHSVIVIPANHEEISKQIELVSKANNLENYVYEFNPFSEYLMIDLYTPDGLNRADAYGPYIFNRPNTIKKSGVRIYHVDSRIFKCTAVNYEGGTHLSYEKDYVWDGNPLKSNQAILMPISNNKTESTTFNLPKSFDYFDQIRLLEASGIDTFSYKDGLASESTLWNTHSNPFDIANFGYQFFNGNYSYNDGKDLPFKIKVTTLKEI